MEIEKFKSIGWRRRKIFLDQATFTISQPKTKKGEIKKVENYLLVKIQLDEMTTTGFFLLKDDKKKLYRTMTAADRIALLKSFEEHTSSLPLAFRKDQRKRNLPVKRIRCAAMELKATKVRRSFLAIHDTVEQFDAILGTLQANILISNAHNTDKMEICLNNLIAIRDQLGEEFDILEEAIEDSHVQQVALETKKLNEANKLSNNNHDIIKENSQEEDTPYEIEHPFILEKDYESLTDKELKHIKKREAEEQRKKDERKKKEEEDAEEERMRLEEAQYELTESENNQLKNSKEDNEPLTPNPNIHRVIGDDDIKIVPEKSHNQSVTFGRVEFPNIINRGISITPQAKAKEINKTLPYNIAKLSMHIFHSDSYDFEPRISLSKVFKTEKNSYEFKNFATNEEVEYPIFYHEPISELQKLCEMFMYSDLLDKASQETDESIRMCYILGFIAAQHSRICSRLFSSFNALRGETFEYIDNERKFQFFAEQVSIQPNIAAYNCQSANWSYYGDSRQKYNYNRMKEIVQYDMLNKEHFDLTQIRCCYTFNKPSIILHKINKAKIRITVEGKVIVKCSNNSNIRGEIEFFQDKTRPKGDIEGKVINNGYPQYDIKGNILHNINYTEIRSGKVLPLWAIMQEDYLINNPQKNEMPIYTYNLNYFHEKLADVLPPTDSRRRPDLREYEEGSNDVAGEIYKKLRDGQKKLAKEKTAKSYKPAYFSEKKNKFSEDCLYIFNDNYWQDREKQNWAAVNPTIFK